MSNVYENLTWLPELPKNYNERIKNVSCGVELLQLSQYRLDDNKLKKIYNKLQKLIIEKKDLTPLTQSTLGLISNANTKLIVPSLIGTAVRHGLQLTVIEVDFNKIDEEIFNEKSNFDGYKIQTILIAIDYRGLPLNPKPGDQIHGEENIKQCVEYLKNITNSIIKKTKAQIILQNIAPPVESIFGSYERILPGTINWLCSKINLEIDKLNSNEIMVLDIKGLASNIGLNNWHDPTIWNLAKISFSQKYTPMYSEYICRILGVKNGKSRRCLILDLDNTLWGGVIGDDGIEGINIGNGDATGEAYVAIQKLAMQLHDRGIVLAISSKNEDHIAREPFKNHPDMILREKHIAVFQANWKDKASNIRAIAESLSLGLESIVFLDDNPAERMQIRKELPQIAVPELPSDPALYPRQLMIAGYFEAIAFSEEDSKRANFYQDNAKRIKILNESSDMESYLNSLEMEAQFKKFDHIGRSRIAQLISKSNQFNLTTKRYTELEIAEIEKDENYYTRQIRLKDILGDNGMISVVICLKKEKIWEIDTWLMSCRVLGRRVEEIVLQDIIKNAQLEGVTKIIGKYIPTKKNVIVKDHYEKLGFNKRYGDEIKEIWELELKNFVFMPLPIKINYAI
jgi:FkbH-like protein